MKWKNSSHKSPKRLREWIKCSFCLHRAAWCNLVWINSRRCKWWADRALCKTERIVHIFTHTVYVIKQVLANGQIICRLNYSQRVARATRSCTGRNVDSLQGEQTNHQCVMDQGLFSLSTRSRIGEHSSCFLWQWLFCECL